MSEAILLIAPEDVSLRVAEALRAELENALEVVATRRAGMALLRRGEYGLVLLDESILMADGDVADALYQAARSAPVLELNFGITGPARIVRQVKAALGRREHDRQQARAAVAAILQSELNASLSGLLLESQLALRGATGEQARKLKHVVQLAEAMREKLRMG